GELAEIEMRLLDGPAVAREDRADRAAGEYLLVLCSNARIDPRGVRDDRKRAADLGAVVDAVEIRYAIAAAAFEHVDTVAAEAPFDALAVQQLPSRRVDPNRLALFDPLRRSLRCGGERGEQRE